MIDRDRHNVDEVHLPPHEWTAFEMLEGRLGHVVTLAEFIARIWPENLSRGQPRTLVWSLRRLLRDTSYEVRMHPNIGVEMVLRNGRDRF
jgi:DNA-binding winged helix-turn-helix (wHTH) protein